MKNYSLFLTSLALWKSLGYALISLGLVFEGDGALFAAGFLAEEGFFDFGDIAIIVLCSVLAGDVFWFYIGKKYIGRYPKAAGFIEKLSRPFDRHLAENPSRTLLATKFVYGAHHAVLIRAGMSNMNFRSFVRNDFPAALVWILAVGGLGWFSGMTLVPARKYLRFVEISLLCALLGFFILEYSFRRFSEKELEKNF